MPGRDSADPGQACVAVVAEQVGQGEREVVRIGSELAGGEIQHLLLGARHARVRTQLAQRRHPTLSDHPLGVLADHTEHPDHGRVVVAQRAVGERVVRLLAVAGPLQHEHQGLVPGRLPGRQDALDSRTDVRPDLGPHLAGRAAERPRVFEAQRVAAIGGIAEKRQLRTPRHPHGKSRRQQDVHGRTEALRPSSDWSERR